MIEQYFKEAKKVILDAKAGKIKPSLEFLDMTNESPLRISSRIGFTMGRYMIIFGPSGTGKTALADTEMVLNPILKQFITEPKQRTNIEVIYRSMERPPVDKMIKWIAYLLYWKYRMIIDVPTLMQLPNRRRELNSEDLERIDSLSPYIEYISECVTLLGGARTPAELYDYNLQQIYKNGAYFKTDMDHIYCNSVKIASFPVNDKPGQVHTKSAAKFDFGIDKKGNIFVSIKKEGKEEVFLTQQSQKFLPRDDKKILVVLNDTINKIQGDDALKTLNAHSRYMGELRDAGAISGIDISQVSKEDVKKIDSSLHMTQGHVKGTGDIANNADTIISIVDPLHYEISTWNTGPGGIYEYDASRCQGTLRVCQIVKNSHGLGIHKFPFIMLGENGYFYELPSTGMKEEDYRNIEENILKVRTYTVEQSSLNLGIEKINIPNRTFNSKEPF